MRPADTDQRMLEWGSASFAPPDPRTGSPRVYVELHRAVAISAEDIAEVFWGMDDDDQAKFFSHLGAIADVKLCFQMAGVSSSEFLNQKGRNAMEIIGNHAREAKP